MILRKPYAMFIKYFKMIHAVMAFFVVFLLYRSWVLYNYFRVYSVDFRGISNIDSFGIGIIDYLFIIVALILTVVLFSVMYYKDKPKKLYIYNFAVFMLFLVLTYYCGLAFVNMKDSVLDIKASKAFRDLYFIALLAQAVSLFLTIVRATGFDIKQFDFGTDIQKLNISERDYEEIEVSLQFDQDEFKRNIRKFFRSFKYVYFEHRFIINLVSFVLIVSIASIIYFRISSYSKWYNQGDAFETSNLTFSVMDSYLLDKDLYGRELVQSSGEQGSVLVAVRFQVSSYSEKKLNTGIINLRIGDISYTKNDNYLPYLYDLGTPYSAQKLTSELKTYLAVFEVSKTQAKKSIFLKVNDMYSFVGNKMGAKNNYIKLKPIDLRKDVVENETKNLGEDLHFNDSILASSSISITEYEINNKIRLNYKHCYRKDKCIDSYEYVVPSFTGNYFKTLMRISGSFKLDKSINNSSITNFESFMNSFCVIHYKLDGSWYKKNINSENIKPVVAKTNDYFIEIPLEAKDASELYFTFEIRNQIYKYSLK